MLNFKDKPKIMLVTIYLILVQGCHNVTPLQDIEEILHLQVERQHVQDIEKPKIENKAIIVSSKQTVLNYSEAI